MKSISLPHCWVCSARFSVSKPPGPANKEIHHIIPRQAGGSDGPTVDLCENHHGKAHKIALRLSSNKPHFDLLVGEPDEAEQKLMWLASRIYMAFEAVKGDPNKKMVVVLGIDRKKQKQIDMLKKVYNVKSREAVYDIALQSLFSKNFTEV